MLDLHSDFMLAETLMVREATLRSAIEEKVGEIGQNYKFKNWGILNFEVEVQLIRGEKRGEEFRKVGENDKVLKAVVGQEKCKFGFHDGKACPVGEQGKKDCPNASGTEILTVFFLRLCVYLNII